MTPFQTYGQTAAPSNMQFPTAAYLQASQNAADMQAKGMSALGSGLASGIDKVAAFFEENKNEQAKFNATKKLFDVFEGYLPEDSKQKVKGLFADTSMSIKDKNQLAPLLLNMLSNAQQQQGREAVAKIQAGSRIHPQLPTPQFDATQGSDPYGYPVNPPRVTPVAEQYSAPYMTQGQPDQPQSVQRGSLSNMPKIRQDPQTGKMQFWSPGAKRYIDESENDLFFGTDFRIIP